MSELVDRIESLLPQDNDITRRGSARAILREVADAVEETRGPSGVVRWLREQAAEEGGGG